MIRRGLPILLAAALLLSGCTANQKPMPQGKEEIRGGKRHLIQAEKDEAGQYHARDDDLIGLDLDLELARSINRKSCQEVLHLLRRTVQKNAPGQGRCAESIIPDR